MTTLLIDNYDSYTYNVFHLLAAVSGEEPIVVHNDMVSWKALSRWDFDAIVISPGPGRPQRWHDFGVCSDVLRQAEIPVLGVCLGHQGLGHVLNATVESAPLVMHGRKSNVHHDQSGLFRDIPQDFSVVRYHSLAVSGDLGPDGHVTAWTEDGVVMGIEHRRRPLWGVQFHPESIATEHGHKLFENFYELAHSYRGRRTPGARRHLKAPDRPERPAARQQQSGNVRVHTRTIDGEPAGEALFERLFGAGEYAFWLDSVDGPPALARSSFMGTSAGPGRCVLEYDVAEQKLQRNDGARATLESISIFDALDRELAARTLEASVGQLPAGLLGGFVGYLGYECKADCGSPNVHRAEQPDAVMMLANRVVAVDHVAHRTTLAALSHRDATEAEAESWLDGAEQIVIDCLAEEDSPAPQGLSDPAQHVSFHCGRGREQYLSDISRCQAALRAGESYEICLTDQIHTDVSPEPWDLYRLLRRRNPAPFAAYLKLGEMAVVSSSPERFLSVDRDRRIQARPIKGTASRSVDAEHDEAQRQMLLSDEKTFAEHLMIVDLLRNDLGRVSELDSVRVPQFMVVESYPTVHQLISTITGILDESRTPVECVRACFPGGSMTGAPKLRTMGIIDDIEREARGVYSGAIGYFGLDGAVDLNIVIRTIVMRPGDTSIGAGGAIVMQSDPAEEFEEILLKARAPMSTIAEAVTGTREAGSWSVELGRDEATAALR